MNIKQKKIVIVYLVLLVLILGLEMYHISFSLISWLRFLTMLSLAILVIFSKKENYFNRVSIIFVLMVMGDFFLVLGNVIKGFEQNLIYLGFIPFTGAYLVLVFIYLKSLKLNITSALLAIPFLMLAALLYTILNPFVEGIFLKSVSFLLLVVLLLMSWSSILFLFRDTLTKNKSIMIAISGILMLACDIGVGFDLFYPDFYQIRNMLPINFVWLFYLPGWVLLAIASIDI